MLVNLDEGVGGFKGEMDTFGEVLGILIIEVVTFGTELDGFDVRLAFSFTFCMLTLEFELLILEELVTSVEFTELQHDGVEELFGVEVFPHDFGAVQQSCRYDGLRRGTELDDELEFL